MVRTHIPQNYSKTVKICYNERKMNAYLSFPKEEIVQKLQTNEDVPGALHLLKKSHNRLGDILLYRWQLIEKDEKRRLISSRQAENAREALRDELLARIG
jgi:hypothetical protein